MLRFQVDHLQASSRRLLTPLTSRTDVKPKLSALISPKDLALPSPEKSTTPTALQPLHLEIDPYFRVMIAMIEYLSGKSLSHYQQSFSANAPIDQSNASTSTRISFDLNSESSAEQAPNERPAPRHRVEVQDAERLAFSIVADVTTSDGQTHSVQLSETHQRQSRQILSVSASEAAKLIDPLIINLEGSLTFSHRSTDFDLDSDGNKEQFRQLGHGSYFLALDLNGDGKINDGSELFGTQSGNGFADLRHYDDDGNGLIDKGDRIFQSLRLFRTNTQTLTSLDEKQILAIGLTAADTPFRFTDSKGNALAQLRQSSFYLAEGGRQGTVQHIDLAV